MAPMICPYTMSSESYIVIERDERHVKHYTTYERPETNFRGPRTEEKQGRLLLHLISRLLLSCGHGHAGLRIPLCCNC